jgi:hypothetical protein
VLRGLRRRRNRGSREIPGPRPAGRAAAEVKDPDGRHRPEPPRRPPNRGLRPRH